MSKLNVIQEEKSSGLPWYKDGLKFQCTECGKCCSGTPGMVWVSENEMLGMAAFLNITLKQFKRKYVRQRDNRYALVEKKVKGTQDYECIFLKDKKCVVYKARPIQCGTFPWWPEHLNSRDSWECAAEVCEGINDQAPIVPYSLILKALNKNN